MTLGVSAIPSESPALLESGKGVSLSRHFLFWGLAALGCGVDLVTKHLVFNEEALVRGQVWWLWPDHAGLQLSLNEGALFGMGQGGTGVFAIFSVAAALAIPAWLFVFRGARDLPLTIALGCIMGGVLGNLYDRLGLPGLRWDAFDPSRVGERVYAVRDFILLAWRWSPEPRERIVWPNFNIADSLLVCGACSLLILSMRSTPAPTQSAP